jgi:Uma2 family endonuclease
MNGCRLLNRDMASLAHACARRFAKEERMAHMATARIWTVDDVHALPGDGNRYEVIDGELLVTPAPSLDHQRLVFLLANSLRDFLERNPVGEVVISPADVVFSDRRGVQPDVFVVPIVGGRRARNWSDAPHPILTAEVLSPSTRRADRVTKRQLFRDERTPDYWIVDPEARVFERSTPADSRVDVLADRIAWSPAAEACEIDIPAFFRRALD